MSWLNIAAGVALTLFGIRFLRKGLERLFDGNLAAWISTMTEHRLKAFAAGVAVGAVAPSSTGLALMTQQMLKTGRVGAERVLAVLLGAGVGVTVTVQLIAFHIQDRAPILLVPGVICFQFAQREKIRGIGQCLLALGFVFLAMSLIGRGGAEIALAPEIHQLSTLLDGHPWLVAFTIAGMAVLLQSSTAVIGLGIALMSAGVLSVTLAVPWIVGTNLGLAVTSLIAGWPAREGRKLGVANLVVKMVVAIPLLALPTWSVLLFGQLPGEELRQIAWFHTGFNFIAAVLALPVSTPLVRLADWMIGGPRIGELSTRPATHLDPRALESPSLALVHANREVLRMADEAKSMLETYWRAEIAPDLALTRLIQRQDDRLDAYHRDIRSYLSSIREGMTEAESRWQFMLLGFTSELEAVGDIIDKHLCDNLLKRISEHNPLTAEDQQALEIIYHPVAKSLDDAIALLATREPERGRALLNTKEAIGERARSEQKAHYLRLRDADPVTLASSTYFLDALNSLRRINSHVSTLAYAFQDKALSA